MSVAIGLFLLIAIAMALVLHAGRADDMPHESPEVPAPDESDLDDAVAAHSEEQEATDIELDIEPPRVSGPDVVGPDLFVTLGFLGSTVEISTCARMIIEFRRGLSTIIDPFADELLQQAKDLASNPSHNWLEDCTRDLQRGGQIMSASLDFFQDCCVARGIYDIGESTLREHGLPDPREFSEIMKSAAEKSLSELNAIFAAQKTALDRAHSDAEGRITGSGMFIAPTSGSMLFAVGIAELAVTASQARRAEKEYRHAASTLTEQALREMDDSMRAAGLTDCYPKLLNFLTRWNGALLDAYMTELAVRGEFDIEPLMEFSSDQSDAMLANLDRVSDQKDLLIRAFQACPYNESVYIEADRRGLLDGKGYRSARYFGFDALLPHASAGQFENYLDESQPYRLDGNGDGGTETDELPESPSNPAPDQYLESWETWNGVRTSFEQHPSLSDDLPNVETDSLPALSPTSLASPDLYVDLEFLGKHIEISTCALTNAEALQSLSSIVNPCAEELRRQVFALEERADGEWWETYHDKNLRMCTRTLILLLDHAMNMLISRGHFDITESAFTENGFPGSTDIIAITNDAGALVLSAGRAIIDERDPSEQKRLLEQHPKLLKHIAISEYYSKLLDLLQHALAVAVGIVLITLESKGEYDTELLDDFDAEQACMILNHVKRVSNKRELLAHAFETCPYESEVYTTAAEYGLLDPEGYRCAKYFGFGTLLPHDIQQRYRQLDLPTPHPKGDGKTSGADSHTTGCHDPAAAVRAAIFEATEQIAPNDNEVSE